MGKTRENKLQTKTVNETPGKPKTNSIEKETKTKPKTDKTHGQDINTPDAKIEARRSGCCYSKPSFDLHRDNFPQLRKQLVNERLKNVPQVKMHSGPGVAHDV